MQVATPAKHVVLITGKKAVYLSSSIDLSRRVCRSVVQLLFCRVGHAYMLLNMHK